jgi:hypothetical protein
MKNLFKYILVLLMIGFCASCYDVFPPEDYRIDGDEVRQLSVENTYGLRFEIEASSASYGIVKDADRCFYFSEDPYMEHKEKIEAQEDAFRVLYTFKGYNKSYYVCAAIFNERYELLSGVEKVNIGPLSDYVTFKYGTVSVGDRSVQIKLNYSVQTGVEVTEAGVCYGQTENLTIDGSHSVAVDGVAVIENLEPGQNYTYCHYVKDGDYVAYSAVSAITAYGAPAVTTGDVTGEYVLNCEVTGDGGKGVTSRGIIYVAGGSQDLSLSNGTKVTSGSGLGSYAVTLSSLLPNQVYSYRAYASNSIGTGYGEIKTFVTGKSSPAIGQIVVDYFASDLARLSFPILSDGGCDVSEAGVYIKEKDSDLEWKVTGELDSDGIVRVEIKVDDERFAPRSEYVIAPFAVNMEGETRETVRLLTLTTTWLEDGNTEGFGSSEYEW